MRFNIFLIIASFAFHNLGFGQKTNFGEEVLFTSNNRMAYINWDGGVHHSGFSVFPETHSFYIEKVFHFVPQSEKVKPTKLKLKKEEILSPLKVHRQNTLVLINTKKKINKQFADLTLRRLNNKGSTIGETPIFTINDNENLRSSAPAIPKNFSSVPFQGRITISENEEFIFIVVSKGYTTERCNTEWLTTRNSEIPFQASKELMKYAILNKDYEVLKTGEFEDNLTRGNLVSIESRIENSGKYYILYNYCHKKNEEKTFPIKILSGSVSNTNKLKSNEFLLKSKNSVGFKTFWNNDSLKLIGYTAKLGELGIDGVYELNINLKTFEQIRQNQFDFSENNKSFFNRMSFENGNFVSKLKFDIKKDNKGIYYFVQRFIKTTPGGYDGAWQHSSALTVFQLENGIIKKLSKLSNLKHNLYSKEVEILRHNDNLYVICNQHGEEVHSTFYQFRVPVFIKINDNPSYGYSEKSLVFSNTYQNHYIRYAWKSLSDDSIIIGIADDKNRKPVRFMSFPINKLLD